MKWFIVVMFYTLHGDIYIFTEPTFDTREECVASVKDPAKIPAYSRKLVLEYGRLLPIQAINCLEEKQIENLLGQEKA